MQHAGQSLPRSALDCSFKVTGKLAIDCDDIGTEAKKDQHCTIEIGSNRVTHGKCKFPINQRKNKAKIKARFL